MREPGNGFPQDRRWVDAERHGEGRTSGRTANRPIWRLKSRRRANLPRYPNLMYRHPKRYYENCIILLCDSLKASGVDGVHGHVRAQTVEVGVPGGADLCPHG